MKSVKRKIAGQSAHLIVVVVVVDVDDDVVVVVVARVFWSTFAVRWLTVRWSCVTFTVTPAASTSSSTAAANVRAGPCTIVPAASMTTSSLGYLFHFFFTFPIYYLLRHEIGCIF